MQDLYYNAEHPSSYGGVARLAQAVQRGKHATQEWLRTQRTYTLHKPVRKRYSTKQAL